MNTVIKQLSSGYEVEVRPVPPTAYLDVEMEFARNHPPPQKPKVSVKSVAGHTEEIASAMDSPEYQAYEHQIELRDMELRAAKINFAYNYAVVRWREYPVDGNKAGEWQTNVPNTWQPDPSILDKTSDKRIIFIKYELIATLDDDREVSLTKKVAPMNEEEVATALKGFRPDQEQRTSGSGTYKRKAHRR